MIVTAENTQNDRFCVSIAFEDTLGIWNKCFCMLLV